MRKAVWKALAVVASAAMFVLALPPCDLYPLGFFCFVPVLFAVSGRGFAVGFACGMGVLIVAAFLASTGWFYRPSLTGESPEWLYAGFALFGLVVAGVCAVMGESKSPSRWYPFVLAAVAVVLEALLLVYLPTHLALTQYRSFPAMRIASVTGIWGVSYLLWVVNIGFVFAAMNRSRATLLVIGGVLGVYVGLSTFTARPSSGGLKVGLVQTDSQLFDQIAELHSRASGSGADIVVWPELSALSIPRAGKVDLLRLGRESSPFVTSFEEPGTDLPFNSAAVFSKDGESAHYRKRKPFAGESKEHAAGTKAVAVHVEGTTYGLNICFDSCFPSIMRETASIEGVDAILLPTLDPVAPYGTIQAMHASYTPFRAAELGLPIVRADTTAYSMIVDRRGAIVAEAGSGTEETVVAVVEPGRRWTVYQVSGDWFLYLCAAACLIGALFGRRTNVRRPVETE